MPLIYCAAFFSEKPLQLSRANLQTADYGLSRLGFNISKYYLFIYQDLHILFYIPHVTVFFNCV